MALIENPIKAKFFFAQAFGALKNMHQRCNARASKNPGLNAKEEWGNSNVAKKWIRSKIKQIEPT